MLSQLLWYTQRLAFGQMPQVTKRISPLVQWPNLSFKIMAQFLLLIHETRPCKKYFNSHLAARRTVPSTPSPPWTTPRRARSCVKTTCIASIGRSTSRATTASSWDPRATRRWPRASTVPATLGAGHRDPHSVPRATVSHNMQLFGHT